jgi:ATP-dependent DNA helicase Rep
VRRSGRSAAGRTLVSPAAAAQLAQSDARRPPRRYLRYDDTLRAYQAVDFDDLIALPIALLEAQPEVAARWRQRCAQLLVDEYQDTNPAQYRLLKILAGEAAAFTAVGDDDQAIYGWRGASLDNLAQLPRDYPALKVIAGAELPVDGAHPPLGERASPTTRSCSRRSSERARRRRPDRVTPAADDERRPGRRAGSSPTSSSTGAATPTMRCSTAAITEQLFQLLLRAQNVPYTISGRQCTERTEIRTWCLPAPHRRRHDDPPVAPSPRRKRVNFGGHAGAAAARCRRVRPEAAALPARQQSRRSAR